jgi:sec-independent protein translocase protein TatC
MITFHIKEFKWRLFYSLFSWVSISFIIWNYKLNILFYLTSLNLIFTSLTEAFYLYIYFSILIGFIFNLPFFYYQLYSFILPALFYYQVNYFVHLWIFIWFYFIYNATNVFSFFIDFFTLFQSEYLNLLLTFHHFISFLNNLILLFILLLIIPFLISVFKLFILNNRKIVYFSLACVIALLTPPDILSLFIVFIPLFILSEFFLLFSYLLSPCRHFGTDVN